MPVGVDGEFHLDPRVSARRRLETYAIRGERGSGVVCLNGAAARLVQVGDVVIIISYALMTPEEARVLRPVAEFPDENNRLVRQP